MYQILIQRNISSILKQIICYVLNTFWRSVKVALNGLNVMLYLRTQLPTRRQNSNTSDPTGRCIQTRQRNTHNMQI
jgi:hypothetical protein